VPQPRNSFALCQNEVLPCQSIAFRFLPMPKVFVKNWPARQGSPNTAARSIAIPTNTSRPLRSTKMRMTRLVPKRPHANILRSYSIGHLPASRA
jgi:hypothetical protein